MDAAFADRLHDDAMTLLLAARDWAVRGARACPVEGDAAEGLFVAVESMRLTALVTDSVAWTLAQKAVVAGELDENALAEACWAPVELNPASGGVAPLPPVLASLLEKAERLHRRVTHLYALRRDEVGRRGSAG